MGENDVAYRPMTPADIPAVSQLVACVFDIFVAPEYSPGGVQEFHRYITEAAFETRFNGDYFNMVAVANTEIVGMIEMRNHEHISLLFIDPAYQHQGIARTLVTQAIHLCQLYRPALSEISVNSSPFAVPFYKRVGFSQIGDQQVSDGMIYVSMVMTLAD